MSVAAHDCCWPPTAVGPPAAPRQRSFLAASALLFVASAAGTILWCGSMGDMGAMPMPGGWSMSMTWMRAPGGTWAGAAASFTGMWTLMMVAMMLPSVVPMLARFRRAVGPAHARRLDALTAAAGAGYFLVWALLGLAAFPLGAAAAALAMRSPGVARAVPAAVAATVAAAGLLQLTDWKAHHLACCRTLPRPDRALSPDVTTAWRCGLSLGVHCAICCLGFTVILLVAGVMDLRVMAAATALITAERVAPAGARVARAAGVATASVGLALLARATGLA